VWNHDSTHTDIHNILTDFNAIHPTVGKETHHITNTFRHTNIQTAFRTNSTIHNLLTQRNPNDYKFSSSGVYKLTCPECGKAYVGQTVRQFSLRYKEHRRVFYSNTPSSSFAHLNEVNPFGPIHETIQVLHHHTKGPI
jgi:hypothetical protein